MVLPKEVQSRRQFQVRPGLILSCCSSLDTSLALSELPLPPMERGRAGSSSLGGLPGGLRTGYGAASAGRAF